MFTLPPPLYALGEYHQFIVYRLEPSETKPGKFDKIPIDWRSVVPHNPHDPEIWLDWQQAAALAECFGPTYGIGFVITRPDPFFFLDIDDCLQGGQWSPIALELLRMFPGAGVEVSVSGTGLHILGKGDAPLHRCKSADNKLEFYTENRFLALTGTNAIGNVDTVHTSALAELVARYFPPDMMQLADVWTTGPCEAWRGPIDDETLIQRALRSASAASAFGGHASFADLWSANVDALAKAYPDTNRAYDESRADGALAQHLAFWTGKDCERIARLMRKSLLVRPKWEREDYIARTIMGAVARQVDVLQDKPPAPNSNVPPAASGPLATLVTGATFLSGAEQIEFFRGCVYVCNVHRVLVPGGRLLKPEQFKTMFGGYSFPMDAANEKVTRNAWEAFTESQTFRSPRADATCFRPELAPAAVFEQGGVKLVNSWWPIDTLRTPGDASPFIGLLERLLPIKDDREKLLAYMAALVQFPGRKFQWAPVIQGLKGNGKTFLMTAVSRSVGERYSHFVNTSDLGDNGLKFTGWLEGKVFVGFEEIYTSDRRDVLDALKPLVTNSRVEIQGKGQDQFTGDNRANFIMCSNHKDAVPIKSDERRFAIFYTAQQVVEDLARDKMDGGYFPDLYDWFEGWRRYEGQTPGYAIINNFFREYAIPDELNPATQLHRAPHTSATAEALQMSLGTIEQEVLEAIEQEQPGFAGGWVSSMALDKLIARLRLERRMSPRKRHELLTSLGYGWHPALSDGRVNNVVQPDNGKPRLFIRKGHLMLNESNAGRVAEAYQRAQTKAMTASAGFGVDGTVNKVIG